MKFQKIQGKSKSLVKILWNIWGWVNPFLKAFYFPLNLIMRLFIIASICKALKTVDTEIPGILMFMFWVWVFEPVYWKLRLVFDNLRYRELYKNE